ncbi:MAG TPA: GDP-fucose synthetase [Candidatus Omnitrophica bacterium]|nr:GDP-fucose synthetase [Candidatus Omnitrophota bacterium]HCI44132.1 GDP-fucose synthetase [Candidatus Omnitrophota bacterium]
MNKDSRILVVGHNDIIEKSLTGHFTAGHFTHVFSSSAIALNAAIQPAVYDFFAEHRPEYVFLTSTRSGGIEANQKQAAEFIYHNLGSQNNIVYAAWKFGVKKLLYLASSCVYPKGCPQPIKPECLLTGELEQTSEPYAVAKIAGIKLCQAYRRQYGLNAIVAIPATVYGPGSDTDPATAHVLGALLGKFIDAAKNNSPQVTIWGTGVPRREFLFADDFVAACLFLMERYEGDGVMHIGSGSDVTIKELAEMIQRVCGYEGRIVFDAAKPDGAMRKLLDSSRLTQMGWRPKVLLEEGIRRMYEHC